MPDVITPSPPLIGLCSDWEGQVSRQLVLTANATTIDARGGSGAKYRLTTPTTDGITITITNLPAGLYEWDAELMITTTAVPATVTFAGATVVFMTGLTFTAYPMTTGHMSRVVLSKQVAGRVTAMVYPSEVIV